MNEEEAGVKPTLTRQDIVNVLLDTNSDVRAQFLKSFRPGFENFVILMDKAYRAIEGFEKRVPNEMRSAWTYTFLFIGFNNLLTSFHFQLSGFTTPGGHMMRQYGECIAMALLCSHDEIAVFDSLMELEENFPVHKAMDTVKRKRNLKLLNLDAAEWDEFDQLIAFYSNLSHPSLMAAGTTHVFASRTGRVIGAAFDPAKINFYNSEVVKSLEAAMRLPVTVEQCVCNLNKEKRATPKQRNGV